MPGRSGRIRRNKAFIRKGFARSSARIVALGQALETDSITGALKAIKTRTLGQALETDIAQPLAKIIKIGQALETDLSQVVTARKTKVLGQALETDTAQSITFIKTPHKGRLVVKTDAVQRAYRLRRRRNRPRIFVTFAVPRQPLGQTLETDVAQPVTALKTKAIGQALETDTSQAITRIKRLTIGQALETDSATAVKAIKTKLVNQVNETDTAQAITRRKTLLIGQALETDTAQPVSAIKLAPARGSQFIRTDAVSRAYRLRRRRNRPRIFITVAIPRQPLGQANETDQAQSITPKKTRILGQVTETDIAQTITRIKRKQLGLNTETDTAFSVTSINQVPELHDFCQAHIDEFTTRTTEFFIAIPNIDQPIQSVSSILQQITSGSIDQFIASSITSTPIQGASITTFVTRTVEGFICIAVVGQNTQSVSGVDEFITRTVEGFNIIVLVDQSINHINLTETISKALSEYLAMIAGNDTQQAVTTNSPVGQVSSAGAVTGVTIIP